MMNMTPVVKQILIINIIFFLGSLAVPVSYEYFSLYFPENYHFKLWQLLTHMFMHGGFMHIAFNMIALISFGSALEHFWGGKKFIFFYISCGLGAALLQLGVNYLQIQHTLEAASGLGLSDNTLHQILNVNFSDGTFYRDNLFFESIQPILEKAGKLNLLNKLSFKSLFDAAVMNQTPMVGASGAIYGLLVAFAFMFPNAELMFIFVPVPVKAKYFVPGIIAVDLFLGFKGDSLFGSGGTGVAHFAHVGGALVGYLMMWYWKKNQFNNNRWN